MHRKMCGECKCLPKRRRPDPLERSLATTPISTSICGRKYGAVVTECAAEAIIPGKTCTFRSECFFSPPPFGATEQIALSLFVTSHFFFVAPPLFEDHKWLNARLHLFDSPAGAFITPFIPSASSAATIVFTAPLWPAAPPRLLQSCSTPRAPFQPLLFPRLTEDVSRFDISARKMTMRPLSTGHEERPGRVFIGLDVIGHLWSNNGRGQKNKK